jgi:hypothetical protein
VAWAGFAQQPAAPAAPFVERPESDLVLLAVDVEHLRVSDSIAAFGDEKRVFIPLGEIARLLSFAIEVNVVNGTADGFFIREARRFHLDARTAAAVVEGRVVQLRRDDVEVHQDDIYIVSQALGKCLPVDAAVDFNGAVLRLQPREPLPMQLAVKRQQELSANLAALGYGGPVYPEVPNPYHLFDVPTIDHTSRFSSEGGLAARQTRLAHSTLLTGDLFGLSTSLYATGENARLDAVRFSAGRRDPEARLLGALRAREFGFGEVLFPGIDLVTSSVSGPGFVVSSFPVQQRIQFDKQTFIGNLPIGWEVELKRNGMLIGYQQASPDGRYRFEDIPLLFGFNVFRLVFYGPQGQQREEVQTFNIGETLVPRGEFRYRLVGNNPRNGGSRALLEGAWGVAEHLSTSASLTQVSLLDGVHRYAQAGLQGFSHGVFAYAEGTVDTTGGNMERIGVQTRVGPVTLSAYRAQMHDFVSEVFAPGQFRLTARTLARLSGTLNAFGSTTIPLTLDLTRDDYASASPVYTVSGFASTIIARTSITNRIFGLVGDRTVISQGRSLFGSFLISRNLRVVSARGEYDYDLSPRYRPNTLFLTLEDRGFVPYLLSVSTQRTFADRITHYILGASRDQGLFSVGIDADLASRGGPSLRIFLSASLLRDPFTRRWQSYARANATQGAAAARVFLDTNQNGRYDPGEPPIEKVGFFVNRGSTSFTTNQNGTAVITNLQSDQPTDLSISSSTLVDPLYVPERPGVHFIPRQGKTLPVEFPVLVTGEVTGTVYVNRGGVSHEASGVTLELVDATGKISKTTRTAYDGFYDIATIVPGHYTLRVSPEQAVRIGLSGPLSKPVVINADGTILDGLNFVLSATAPPVIAGQPTGAPPVNDALRMQRAASLAAVDDINRGRSAFEELLAAPGLPRPVLVEVARALVALQDFVPALTAFDRIAPLQPGEEELAFEHAVALYEAGRYSEAKSELHRVLPMIEKTPAVERYRIRIEGAIAQPQ